MVKAYLPVIVGPNRVDDHRRKPQRDREDQTGRRRVSTVVPQKESGEPGRERGLKEVKSS